LLVFVYLTELNNVPFAVSWVGSGLSPDLVRSMGGGHRHNSRASNHEGHPLRRVSQDAPCPMAGVQAQRDLGVMVVVARVGTAHLPATYGGFATLHAGDLAANNKAQNFGEEQW